VRTYWRRWFDAWSRLEVEVDDVVAAGDDVVALLRNQRQWGRRSDICTELPPYAQVFTFRGPLVVRWRAFPDQQSALSAVGLADAP
jgi:hypothetical protein